MAKDNHWFKHEYDADDGDNLVMLRLKGGNAAIGLYWRTYPKIHKASNRYPLATDTARDVLAAKLAIARDVLDEFLQQAIECNLFKIEDGFLCSDKVEEQLAEQQAKSKNAAESGRLGGLAKASKTLANAKQNVASRVEKSRVEKSRVDKSREEKSKREGTNTPHPKKQTKIIKGDPPSEQNDKIPIELQELFKSQNKTEQIKNVWLTDAECERIAKKWGLQNFELACQQMTAWSVNPDINSKTKLAGWESYRLKRDHAGTMENILKRLENEGKLKS